MEFTDDPMVITEDPVIDSFLAIPLAQFRRELEEAEKELSRKEESDALYEARTVMCPVKICPVKISMR